ERHAAMPPCTSCWPPGSHSAQPAAALGLSRNTVLRFARAARADELLEKATSREPSLYPFKPYLNQRRDEGITDASVLQPSCKPGTGGATRGPEVALRAPLARAPPRPP